MTQPAFPAHSCLPEPQLAFHPDRPSDRNAHPLLGLLNVGPYSRSLVNNVLDPIRVAMIAPHGDVRKIVGLVEEVEAKHEAAERKQYLPAFLGFSRIFGLRMLPASDACRIELPRELDAELAGSAKPHLVLAERVTAALQALSAHRTEFNVVMILLPQRWERAFEGGEGEDFDLHDFIKAAAAALGVPTQVLNEDSALAYPCRCSVMWRISIAAYAKAGGVPWKLADAEPETAYVGVSYARKPGAPGESTYVVCCSQVFDADGAGLQFLAYEPSDVRIERRNPYLSRAEMHRLMARSLSLYQQRHAGRLPRHVVVHKSTEFKAEEVDGCFDAWKSVPTLELIQVQDDPLWRGVRIDAPDKGGPKGAAAAYPCQRGTYLPIGQREVIVWTQGNAPEAIGGREYFKEGKGIPSPLLLRRFAGHGGWAETVRRVLGLTKMNWNNDGLYDRLPVTLLYSQVLARVVRHMPSLAPRPYELRFFI